MLIRPGGLSGDHVDVVGDLHFLRANADAEYEGVVTAGGGLADVGPDAVAYASCDGGSDRR